jgi:hypothetical protein
MLKEIPELYDEQNLLGIMDKFYKDVRVCGVSYDSYRNKNTLYIEGCELYESKSKSSRFRMTDGKIVIGTILIEYDKFQFEIYNIEIDDSNIINLTLQIKIEDFILIDDINRDNTFIVGDLIIIYQNTNIISINTKTGKTLTYPLNYRYESLHIWNNKYILKSSPSLISILENDVKPFTYMNYEIGSEISFRDGNFYTHLYKDGLVTINKINIYTDDIIESVQFKTHKKPKKSFYINPNLIFCIHSTSIHIIKNGIWTNIPIYDGDSSRIEVDNYNEKVLITKISDDYNQEPISIIYDIATGKINHDTPNINFCYF